MIDYHLISDIALGDVEFQRNIIKQYELESEDVLSEASKLIANNSWTLLHLRLKEYRNKISPYLNKPSLNRLNAVMEIMISPLNASAKLQAYKELSSKIKRELGFLQRA